MEVLTSTGSLDVYANSESEGKPGSGLISNSFPAERFEVLTLVHPLC